MSDPELGKPPQKRDGSAKTANKERLAMALRENLRRRKAQRGARKATKTELTASPAAADDSDPLDNSGPAT